MAGMLNILVHLPIITLTPAAGSGEMSLSNHPVASPSLSVPSLLTSCHLLGGNRSTLNAILSFLSSSGELSEFMKCAVLP